MKNFKIKIQYDGTNYFGWQRQKKHVSVQSKIEEILKNLFKEEIKVRGAGRTDAGVHALEQVATFKATLKFPPENLKKALNSLLPPDIRVYEIEEVDLKFHPQYSAKRKSYIYYLCNDIISSPFLHRYVWHLPWNLNILKMQNAGDLFVGKFDFSAFSGSTDVKNRIRTVFELTIEQINKISFLDILIEGNFIKFRIEADGFLKYMARNIVGCLVEIGRGGLKEEAIVNALSSKIRPNPMRTAPPQGLFLERIIY